MVDKRIMRVGAIVAVAGATGFVMQTQAPSSNPNLTTQVSLASAPIAAPQGTTDSALALTTTAPLADAAGVTSASPEAPALTLQAIEPVTSLTEAQPTETADAPVRIAALSPAEGSAGPRIDAAPLQAAAPSCDADIALIAQKGAMIDLGMLSDCRPNQRVVIRHGGIAVTAVTSPAGTLIARIPALTHPAEVSLTFLDGSSVSDAVEIPDLASYERFAIQWMESDAFQLRVYKSGFERSETDTLSAEHPGEISEAGNFLIALGDAKAPRPLLAEIYTWPRGETAALSEAALAIEAAVTSVTCNREILGETLQLSDGKLTVRELSMNMPACDAVGEYVALPNPVLERKLAQN